MLNHGTLAGTGRMVILPVDQGFEHGPARSFAVNPPAYDPLYHYQLAIDAGCNAYAAPLGFIEAGAAEFAGDIPLILKMNNHDVLNDEKDPLSAVTATVKDAQRLGCVAAGFTIYPGSANAQTMYQQCREMIAEARDAGLASVVWSYPRGSSLSKEGETALAWSPMPPRSPPRSARTSSRSSRPRAHREAEAKKAYDKAGVPMSTLASGCGTWSSRPSTASASSSSGRATRTTTTSCSTSIASSATAARSADHRPQRFQRKREHALAFLGTVMKIYSGELK